MSTKLSAERISHERPQRHHDHPAGPAWCVLPAGHEFYSITQEATLFRSHEGPDRSVAHVAISLVSDETALSNHGPVATIEAPMVWVGPDDMTRGRLTGPEARQIAAALLNAADEWDQITGAS